MEQFSLHENPERIILPYGKEHMSFSVHENCKVYTPRSVLAEPPEEILAPALSDPVDMPPLKEFVEKTRKLLIIVNDGTRPSLTPFIINHIHPLISTHFHVHFLIATGTHPRPGGKGLLRIFGDLLRFYRDRITPHVARNEKELVSMGTTSRGTDVTFNRRIMESDGIISIGNVKPHYFAGFAGGRKSFLPGIAGYRTIEMNHSLALEDGSQPMVLEGNPLAEDMEEGVRMLGKKRIFSVQTVVDREHRLVGAFCGDLFGSFNKAVERTKEIYAVPVTTRGNIIITANPYPMDIDLYQSQHALENVKHVVEEGGIIILVSKCWGGVGNPAYLDLLDRGGTREGVERIINQGYRLGHHKALRFLKMGEHAQLWAVTDLDERTILRSRMKPYEDIQKAVDDAVTVIRGRGIDPRIKVFPLGGMTVPYSGKT